MFFPMINVLWCFLILIIMLMMRKKDEISLAKKKMKTFFSVLPETSLFKNRTEQNNRLYFWIWKTEKSDPKSIKIGKNSDSCLQTKLTNHYHCFRSVGRSFNVFAASFPHPNEYRMKQTNKTKKRIIFRNISSWRWWTNQMANHFAIKNLYFSTFFTTPATKKIDKCLQCTITHTLFAN